MRKTPYICTHKDTREQREIQAFSDLRISDNQVFLVYNNPQPSIDTNRKILVDCIATTESC